MVADIKSASAKQVNAILFPIVGIVLLAIVFAIALIIWTAKTTDEASLNNEKRLIRGGIQIQLDILAKEQEGTAVRDDTFYNTQLKTLDATWLHVNIGQSLSANYGQDFTLMLNENFAPIYYSLAGDMRIDAPDPRFIREITPLIRRTRARFISDFRRLPSGLFVFQQTTASHSQPISEKGVALLNGRPALVSVTAVTPELRTITHQRRPPVTLISAKVLTEEALNELSRMAAVSQLRFKRKSDIKQDEARILLKSPTGSPAAYLTWTPSYPGSEVLSGVTPILGLIILSISVLTSLVLIYTRQSANKLAASEARAQYASLHDSLTGLANRDLFARRFNDALEKRMARNDLLGVVYIDLDHFKDINDTLGHGAGDDVIREATRRLRVIVPEDGLIARISGDEFALMIPKLTSRQALEALLNNIQDRFSSAMHIAGNQIHVSLSVGAAIAPKDGHSLGELLRKADIALYEAKAAGRSRWMFFDPVMEEQVRTRENLARELRRAIDTDELNLVYQPQMTIDGKTVVAVEALVRWNHPTRGELSPFHFVPLAEETGLINDLGLWVLKRACSDAKHWRDLTVAVNVSPSQFRHPQFVDQMTKIIQNSDMNPNKLEIEVTENVFARDTEGVLRALKDIQSKGIKVALDDFGTGYSSLNYLRLFPFDTLKIDRGFIAGLENSHQATAVIATIINLGEALGMKVVAEGLETERQVAFMRLTKCDRLQGFYFSRPVQKSLIPQIQEQLKKGIPASKHAETSSKEDASSLKAPSAAVT